MVFLFPIVLFAQNDICSDAITLNLNGNCVNGNTINTSFYGASNSCVDLSVGSLWYRFTPPFSTAVEIKTNSNYNDVLTVYTGDCSNLTELICTNKDEYGFGGEILSLHANGGTTYYIRLSGQENNFSTALGNSCIEINQLNNLPAIPSNDYCSNAIALTIDNDCTFGTNLHASFEGQTPSTDLRARADVWYQFTATLSSNLRIKTQADFSEAIAVYSSQCNSLVEVVSTDCGQFLDLPDLILGQVYYVQVASLFASTEGNFCISIEEKESPENDACANATFINLDESCIDGTINFATFSGQLPSCTDQERADVWYEFTVPPSGNIRIEANTTFDYTMAVYRGDCSALEEIYCEVDPVETNGYIQFLELESGQNYFIQILAKEIFGEGNLCMQVDGTSSTSGCGMIVNILSEDVSCHGASDGRINAYVAGGVFPHVYYWSDGTTSIFPVKSNLKHGFYSVTINDANGCEVVSSALVASPPKLNLNFYVDPIRYAGYQTGKASAAVFGGQAPYSFEWSNGSTEETAIDLSGGVYYVTVTDANGCNVSGSVEIPVESVPCLGDIVIAEQIATNENKIFEANRIEAVNKIEMFANVRYDAATEITLSDGFNARFNSNFHAYLDGCDEVLSCEVPNGIKASTISGMVVKITWDIVDNAVKYKVRYRPVGGAWIERQTGGAETFRFLNNLELNTDYEYQVKTVCLEQNAVWSSTYPFNTFGDYCDRPSTTVVTDITAIKATISWSSRINELKYKLKYKAPNESWSELLGNVNTIQLAGLNPATTYKYKLKSKCAEGWTNWSSKYNFTTASSLQEIESRVGQTTVELRNYPNPFKYQTTIEYTLDEASEVLLSIFDWRGNKIKTLLQKEYQPKGRHKKILKGIGLPAGVYFYELQTNKGITSKKMIVQ